jgi:hypothetical protein
MSTFVYPKYSHFLEKWAMKFFGPTANDTITGGNEAQWNSCQSGWHG